MGSGGSAAGGYCADKKSDKSTAGKGGLEAAYVKLRESSKKFFIPRYENVFLRSFSELCTKMIFPV